MNFIANESPEKLRGGYYTGADLADFLLRWVLEAAPARILEPSCGDGAFLRALATVRPSHRMKVVGCEIDEAEIAKARETARALPSRSRAELHAEDFLGWALERIGAEPGGAAEPFDAVIGNPPFIRYQYLSEECQERSEAIFRWFGLPFTKHANVWVPFVIASLALLRPGGRLAMVVPSELLHVLHAQSLRAFLLRTCSRVLVIDPEEIWFENTLQGVVLLLAERRDESATSETVGSLGVRRVRGKSFLSEGASAIFRKTEFLPGAELGEKWTAALLESEERDLLRLAKARKRVLPFREVGSVAVGIVTGANKFFLVPDETVRSYGLDEFAHPMFGRSEHVPGVLYDERVHRDNRAMGLPANFLWFGQVEREQLPPGPRRYVARGEAEELHTRYKCRIRAPWYSVPSVFASPVGMLKRSHDHPRLVRNTLGAFTTDTAYRIAPTNGMSADQMVFSHVNSLTALSSELEGRHYGGGVLELVPSEIRRVLVPYAPTLEPDLARLDAMFREKLPAEEILAAQDRAVLGPLGFKKSDRERLLAAWNRLRLRRQRNPASSDESESE